MKVFNSGFIVVILMTFFMFGFIYNADAAFAGQKKTTSTEQVSDSQPPVIAPASAAAADTNTLLLVILAILLPPLAVFLVYNEVGTPFLVNLILTLLFWLPGVIHALYHVLK
ncbi:MAG: YqaE/Pmp3 family membrane protein [Lentimicrobiaceae bacterium]|nr:YqaE/Pmp3 family membrane protein [Lentimicrobiaceae bacterium]